MDRLLLAGVAVGGAALIAYRDERARLTEPYYTDDSQLKEDWALVPIAQRAALAKANGWSETTDQTKPRPITTMADAERIQAYWFSRLIKADLETTRESDAIAMERARAGHGPRATAFKGRIAAAKAEQAHAPASIVGSAPWTSFAGPMSAGALILFWRAIDSAATTVHGVLSQIDRQEVRRMFQEIGRDFGGTMVELVTSVAGTAADIAGTVAGSVLVGVLSHPLVLGALGVAASLYLMQRGNG